MAVTPSNDSYPAQRLTSWDGDLVSPTDDGVRAAWPGFVRFLVTTAAVGLALIIVGPLCISSSMRDHLLTDLLPRHRSGLTYP
jgi:hypothetical protein